MFEKLKEGLSGLVNKIATTELKAEDLRPILWDLKLTLIENDVAVSVADHICEAIEKQLRGVQVRRLEDRRKIVEKALRKVLSDTLTTGEKLDLVEAVEKKREMKKPCVIVFVGIHGTGKCVSGETLIPLADGRIEPIEEIYGEAAIASKEKVVNGGFIVKNPDIQVYSVNPNTLKIELEKPSAVWKLRATEDLFEVTFKNGLVIKTTPEHPFFVLTENGGIIKVRADALKPDDYAMAPAMLPDVDISQRIGFFKYSIEQMARDPKFFLGPKDVVQDIYRFLKKKFGSLHSAWLTLKINRSFNTFAYFWPYNGFIPISIVRRICEEFGYEIRMKYHKFLIKYGRSKPIALPDLDDNFMEFLGFLYSEGHLDNRYVEITNSKMCYLKDYSHLAKILFPNVRTLINADKRKPNLWKAITNSKTLVEFLRHALDFPVGRKGTQLTIPAIVSQQPTNTLQRFLTRYFDGDSHILKDQRHVEITTTSEELQKKLSTILLRYGIIASIGEREVNGKKYYRLWLSGQEKFKKFAQRIGSKDPTRISRITHNINLRPQFELTELVPHIGLLIRLTRKSVRLRQKDVAKKLKTSQGLVSGYETRGIRIPKKRLRRFVELVSSRMGDEISNIKKSLEHLEALAFSDVCWLKVEKVQKKSSPVYVYDLTVDGHHNFVANNLIIHNTTTIAKTAKFLMKHGYSVVFACSDTYRAGAIEQLEEHARRLGVRTIKHQYGADAAAVAFDAVRYAEARGINAVLVDTAGRMQTNLNLMREMEKIVRVIKPDLVLFIGDALTGNDAVTQAQEFDKFVPISASILTKVDADAKGGAAISITHVTKKPILFLGTGQRYEDVEPFKPEFLVNRILGP